MTVHASFVSTSREVLPLVALRDMVVFPHMMAPFIVGREGSVRALEEALTSPTRRLFLVAQKDPKVDEPVRDQLFEIGVVAKVVQNLKLPNGNVKVMVEGQQRAKVVEIQEREETQAVLAETFDIQYPVSDRVKAYMKKILGVFEQYAKASHHMAFEGLVSNISLDDADRFADTLAAHLSVTTPEKQKLLEIINPYERLLLLNDLLEVEIDKANIEKRINVQVKKQMEKAQKEYFLNEKIKAIHDELGRKDDRADEIAELKNRLEEAKLPESAKEKAEQELKRLEAMPPVSAEATVSRNYIDWLLAVPWHKKSRELRDLDKAQEILDADHYGLEKIKERILEFLAVRRLTRKNQTSILCFVGPPGVGKSSLAKSIARATGRKFVRLSLGGVRDEAEIRGHRRTYIGAFPGQIIQMMKKGGTVNPVFLLDEVDKMSMDFRGDPSAALLEVLDPEQNHSFLDHYLDVDFDLSKVMFIATANTIHPVPAALRDRLEILQLSGYTMTEKTAIAKQFLIPRQLVAHGLSGDRITYDDEAIRVLIESYTREAGVRNLEREIASVSRKLARKVVREGRKKKIRIKPDLVPEFLGKRKFRPHRKKEESEVGVATGLAWTEVGGDLLETEVGLVKGKGKLILTGKLGEVMQESARAAVTYIRSRAELLGIDPDFQDDTDVHIHVPEGAIPKDGPSAGITMATALVSALTQNAVRKDVAMTGEITLRGNVLPVGGVKDKVLAAHRAGITEVILPQENEKDVEDIPEEVREALEIHLVESMDQVLRVALTREVATIPQSKGDFEERPAEPSAGPPRSVAH